MFHLGLCGFFIYYNFSALSQDNQSSSSGVISSQAPLALRHFKNDSIYIEKDVKLFRTFCKSSHNENMKADMIGPALGITTLANWVHKPFNFKQYK